MHNSISRKKRAFTFTFTLFLSALSRHYLPGIIMESTAGYTLTSCEIFYFRAIGKKGPTAFSVSSEKHWQSGVKEIAKVSERPQWDSNR